MQAFRLSPTQVELLDSISELVQHIMDLLDADAVALAVGEDTAGEVAVSFGQIQHNVDKIKAGGE